MNYIKLTYDKGIEIDDLDIINIDDILGINEEGHDYDLIASTPNNHNGYEGEVTPIRIDLLIEKLTEFNAKGATHVEIIHHVDHHGYILTPVEMRKANEGEVFAYKRLRDEKMDEARENKIAQLEAEIQRLKG